MATLRNEETQAGKDMWRKVDEAANRAPQWVRSHINTLVDQRSNPPTEAEESQTTTEAKRSK